MSEVQQEPAFARPCAWSGEDVAGRHYVLTTTQGTELVSEGALRRAAPLDTADQLEYLTGAVNALRRRLGALEQLLQGQGQEDAQGAGDVEGNDGQEDEDGSTPPRSAAVPRQRKGR